VNYYQLTAAISDYTQNTFTSVELNTFLQQAEQRIFNTVQFPSIRKNVYAPLSATNQYLSCPADFISVYSLAVIDTTGSYKYLLNKDVNFIREAYPNPLTSVGLPAHYAIYGPQYNNPNGLSLLMGPTPDQSYAAELHYFFYPPSIVPGEIVSFSSNTVGSLYTNGTFYNATLLGGSGSAATATVTVVAGATTSIALQTPGFGYVVGDVLTYVDPVGVGSGGTAIVGAVSSSGQSWLGDFYDTTLLYGALVEAYTFMKGEEDIIKLYEAKYKEALSQAKRAGDALERQDSYRSGQYRQKVN
jgi:hypothetical protein